MVTRDPELKYANLSYDLKTGNGKGWAKYFEAAKEAFKSAPRRPLEEVLGTTFTQLGPIKVAVVTVTPEIAWELLLKHNIRNRPVSYAHGMRLATDIVAGHWQLTHQGGAFNVKGDIQDQQHRLVAVILANQPIQMLMVADLGDDLFKTIDIGKSRSAGSVLELAGHNGESGLLGQVISELAVAYDENAILYHRPSGTVPKRPVSRTEMIEYADDHPDLVEAAHDALDLHANAIAAVGDKATAVMAYWKIRAAFGQDVADEFMDELADDAHSDKHVITMLQRRIHKHKLAKRAGKDDAMKRNVLKRDQLFWLVAAAFRAMRKNLRNVRLDPRGDDEFPKFEDSTEPAPATQPSAPPALPLNAPVAEAAQG